MRNMGDASAYMLLHQIVHLSKYQALKRMETLDLKPGQAGILFILSCKGMLSQRQLAEKMGITPPSMTVALKKLEEMGYVSKEPDEKDQRIVRIRLSAKGEECLGELHEIMKDMEEILYAGMSQEEKLLLRRLLAEMRKNLLESKDFKGIDMESVMRDTRPSMREHFAERKERHE